MSASVAVRPGMTDSLFVWGFGAAFYLLAFFHRVVPAVITDELMRDFQISGAGLGNLSALYFYSYVAMQIPTGLLADRLGPRKLLTAGGLIAALGAVLFALAPDIYWAGVGRLFIGGSVAVAFVGLLKITSCWFSANRFALISGLALFCGIVGAVFAGSPMRLLVDFWGWRNSVLLSSVITLLVAVGIWVFVRDTPEEKGFDGFLFADASPGKQTKRGLISDILHVFSYRNTSLLFLIPGGIVGCVLTFSGLWGVPYLTSVYGIASAEAAAISSVLLVTWAVAGPFFGYFSDRVKNRKKIYLAGCAVSLAGWCIIILVPNLPLFWLVAIMVLVGFSSGCMILTFAYVKESVPAHLAGTVTGVANMGVMMGPMILQPLVGWMLDRQWDGTLAGGVRVYSEEAYISGFLLMLGWHFISLLLLLFTRETNCGQLR